MSKALSEFECRRIGIILVGFDEDAVPAIQHLLLHVNRLQRSFQLEFLPEGTENFFVALAPYLTLNRSAVKAELVELLANYAARLSGHIEKYEIRQKELPHHYVFVTMAKFEEEYYTARTKNFGVIALGNWKRYMAPPTQVEFLLTLMVRESVAALCPKLQSSVHIGTAGCICDFNFEIQDARQKVLSAFVCAYCRRHLTEEGLPLLADQIEALLEKKWFGDSKDPSSATTISAKLGQHLFTTKELQPSFLDRLFSSLKQEGIKQIAKIVGVALIASVGTLLTVDFFGNPQSAFIERVKQGLSAKPK